MKKLFAFVVAVGLPLAAGFVGSYFTMPAVAGWYATLLRPELSPPNWVFGPVWTTLYILMGIASFLVWQKRAHYGHRARQALKVYGFQLGLNVLWSVLFFGLQSPGLALVCVAALWLAIVWTMLLFYRLSRASALLLLPYLAWVSFASYLNYMIYMLN